MWVREYVSMWEKYEQRSLSHTHKHTHSLSSFSMRQLGHLMAWAHNVNALPPTLTLSTLFSQGTQG